jgi:hypothetical protein
MRMISTSSGCGATKCREDPACPAYLLIGASAPRPTGVAKAQAGQVQHDRPAAGFNGIPHVTAGLVRGRGIWLAVAINSAPDNDELSELLASAYQTLQERRGAWEPKRPLEPFLTSAGSLAALAPMCPWRTASPSGPPWESRPGCRSWPAQQSEPWRNRHRPDERSRTLARPAIATECTFGRAVGDYPGQPHRHTWRISRGSGVQPQSLSVIATLARRVRYHRIRT